MAHRPHLLTLLAIVLIAIAFALPLQVIWIYGHNHLRELPVALLKLTWLNWLVMGLCCLCGGLLWRASPYCRLAIPMLVVVVTLNNYVVGYYATDFSQADTALASALFAVLAGPLFRTEIRWLLRRPEQRRWLRAERRRVHVPVVIEGTRLIPLNASTFDISETGLFVPLERGLGAGDLITLHLKFGTLFLLDCQGRVVRRNDALGDYPAGVGIQFTDLSRLKRRELRRHLQRSTFENERGLPL